MQLAESSPLPPDRGPAGMGRREVGSGAVAPHEESQSCLENQAFSKP